MELLAKRRVILAKVATAVLAVAAAVILPQIFHLMGIASGMGGSLGAAFLPMQLPVLLAGIFAGPLAGFAAGVISPVLSFGISGMPALALLPFMTIELACYGFVGGMMKKSKTNVAVKLLAAQVAGRLLRAAAIVIAVFGFGFNGITVQSAWNIVLIGLPGIALQWALIPLLSYRMKNLKKLYE